MASRGQRMPKFIYWAALENVNKNSAYHPENRRNRNHVDDQFPDTVSSFLKVENAVVERKS